MRGSNPLIVAIDRSDLEEADALAAAVAPEAALLKVGLELFVAYGPESVRRIGSHAPLFLDLKLHDIPNTVRSAACNAAKLGISMLTVHSLGGPDMVSAAVEGAALGASKTGVEAPSIVAVTVLSSIGGESLASPASLAFEARSAGAHGVVVSGDDVAEVRAVLDEGAFIVVPGIRPAGSNGHDQVRILTPSEAIAKGADFIVIGRPITRAADPAGAARTIVAEL